MDSEIAIAIVGICISSICAGVGLLFNYKAIQQNNRVLISTKLSEASKLLSDELLLQIRLWKHCETETKVTESRLNDAPDLADKKLKALNEMIEVSINRQKQIDEETDMINRMLANPKEVDINKLDLIISKTYRFKTKALHLLEFVKESKS